MSGLADESYAFNPEFQLEGVILDSTLSWSANLSYWDDNVSDPRDRVTDLNTFYSYKDISLGARIYYFPKTLNRTFSFMELSIPIGLSHDFINGKNILPTQIGNKGERDFGLNVAEIGIRVGIHTYTRIQIVGEYSFKHHLNSKDFITEENRNSFKLGIAYLF